DGERPQGSATTGAPWATKASDAHCGERSGLRKRSHPQKARVGHPQKRTDHNKDAGLKPGATKAKADLSTERHGLGMTANGPRAPQLQRALWVTEKIPPSKSEGGAPAKANRLAQTRPASLVGQGAVKRVAADIEDAVPTRAEVFQCGVGG